VLPSPLALLFFIAVASLRAVASLLALASLLVSVDHALSSVHQFLADVLQERDHEVQALLWVFAGQVKHTPVKSSSAVRVVPDLGGVRYSLGCPVGHSTCSRAFLLFFLSFFPNHNIKGLLFPNQKRLGPFPKKAHTLSESGTGPLASSHMDVSHSC